MIKVYWTGFTEACHKTEVNIWRSSPLKKKSNLAYLTASFLEEFSGAAGNLTIVEFTYLSHIKRKTIWRWFSRNHVDLVEFISNIGGGLGLALGISIFSAMDCFIKRVFDLLKLKY